MAEKVKFLKSPRSGRVLYWTEELAKRPDLVPCDEKGQLLTGHVAESEAAENGVRKAPYIGLVVNGEPGRLFHYTEQLAQKPGAVAIDDPAQWRGDVSNIVPAESSSGNVVNIDRGEDKESGSGPALSRENVADKNQKIIDAEMGEGEIGEGDGSVTGEVETESDPGLTVPDVSGIEDKNEAKGILCKWAFNNFNVNLNRTYGPERMAEECEKLLADSNGSDTEALAAG